MSTKINTKKFMQDAVTKQMGAKPTKVQIGNKVVTVPLNKNSVEKIKNEQWLKENSDKIFAAKIGEAKRVYNLSKDAIASDLAPKVREWAVQSNLTVGGRGRLSREVIAKYKEAHGL